MSLNLRFELIESIFNCLHNGFKNQSEQRTKRELVFKTKPSLELTSPRRPFTVTQRLQFPYFLSFEGKHHPVKEYTYCFSFSFFFSYFFCVDNPDVLILFTYLYLFSLCPTATNLRYFHLSSSIDSKYHPLIPDPKYSSSVNARRHLSLPLSQKSCVFKWG